MARTASDWIARSSWYRKDVAADARKGVACLRPSDSTVQGAAMRGTLGENDTAKAIEYATFLAGRRGVEVPAVVWGGPFNAKPVNALAVATVVRLSSGKRVPRAVSVTFYAMSGDKRGAEVATIMLPHLDYDPDAAPLVD